MEIGAFLTSHGITFDRFDHKAVFTCEESKDLPPMPGIRTKNLFLRDKNGKRAILVVVGDDKAVDLKALKAVIGSDKLSFASPERLKELLGVEPGSVTLLGLVHDTEHAVEVFLDRPVWEADCLQCHPLVNTATVILQHAGTEAFLAATGHEARVIDVPKRQM